MEQADPPLIALVVTDPEGAVVLDETLPLTHPLERTFLVDTHGLGLWIAPFDDRRAVVELVTGKVKDGVPKTRFSRSDELDPFLPADLELGYKREPPWRVEVTLGRVWAAPEPTTGVGACAAEEGSVTARELVATLDDGTGYVVAAGVPVEPTTPGTGRVTLGGLSFAVRLVDGDLGPPQADVASRRFAAPTRSPELLPPGVVGHTALGEVRWDAPTPLPVAARSAVDAEVVTVEVPCARVVLRPRPKEPSPPSAGGW